MSPSPSICAVITARNERRYLQYLLPALAAQQIDVAIIDNDSTDGSLDLYATYAPRPIVHVESLPYRGHASLTDRLSAKQALFARLPHAWLVHHDADEILEHRESGKGLREAIAEADAAGYNALNFDELVFLPEPDRDYCGRDYYRELLRYYFFEPCVNRLNRAWRHSPGVSHFAAGGHRLDGEGLKFPPYNHVLRHYIVLSAEHALGKYLHRIYDPRDIARGWQGNRLNFTAENLRLPAESEYFVRLERHDERPLSLAKPARQHFWEWPQ